MEKETSLSEKIGQGCEPYRLSISEVREAVRRLKERMFNLFGHQTGGTMGEIDFIIDEIFGEKLSEKNI